MAEIDLSEKAAGILRQLDKKYKTEFDNLRIRDCELRILQVSDIAPLLDGKDPFEDVTTFPFWVRLWEAALVLADTMVSMPVPANSRLLELGAGLAAPGLAAAAAGPAAGGSQRPPTGHGPVQQGQSLSPECFCGGVDSSAAFLS